MGIRESGRVAISWISHAAAQEDEEGEEDVAKLFTPAELMEIQARTLRVPREYPVSTL